MTILSSYTASCAQSYSETLEIHQIFSFDTRQFCTLPYLICHIYNRFQRDKGSELPITKCTTTKIHPNVRRGLPNSLGQTENGLHQAKARHAMQNCCTYGPKRQHSICSHHSSLTTPVKISNGIIQTYDTYCKLNSALLCSSRFYSD
jgi:hypothetical protein